MNTFDINCSKCGKPKVFKNKNSYYANRNKKRVCKLCRYENHSEKMTGRTRPSFSKKWKKNLSIGHKNSDVWNQSMNTPEYKEKHRQKMLRLIREGRYGRVGYNLESCKVFDFLNQKLQWSGVHAKNGGERSVGVFILDFYEPKLNIAIEWDEKHHKKPKHIQKDWFRTKIITNQINCEFYRIDDLSKIVKKVDKKSNDRTLQIQEIVNQYYARK